MAPNGTVTIFLGYKVNIVQEFQEVQAGMTIDDIWYKILLPVAMIPADDATSTYDLATDAGITITSRTPRPNDNNKLVWDTNAFVSAKAGLTGKLEISGANVVKRNIKGVAPDGKTLGVAIHLHYVGPATLFGTVRDADLTWDIGSLFTPEVI